MRHVHFYYFLKYITNTFLNQILKSLVIHSKQLEIIMRVVVFLVLELGDFLET